MDEKNLVKLSETHDRLVKGLKSSLKLGQLGFLHAGKFLHQIWSQKTFLSEDSSREVSFTEFCKRPDLPLPGGSDEGRLRTAQKFIRVWEYYVMRMKMPTSKLVLIGYTKLNLLVPVIQTREKEADVWLKKATLLTVKDLIMEIKQKDKSFEELLNCSHKNIEKITFWQCQSCRTRWNHDPKLKQ